MFEDIYGLSCVENQLLSILKENGNEISPFYHNSAIPLKELFFFFVLQGESPYSFYRIPRVQEELAALQLAELKLIRLASSGAVCRQVRSCKKGQYILVRVTPMCTKTLLNARGMREDHYVRVSPQGEQFLIQNDIPEKQLILTAAEFGEIYAGAYLKFTLCQKMEERHIQTLWNSRIFRPEQAIPFTFARSDLDGIPALPLRIREMLFVCRLMRARTEAYYRRYIDTASLRAALQRLTQYCAKAEYLRLRNSASPDTLYQLLTAVNQLDNQQMQILKERLENKNDGKS